MNCHCAGTLRRPAPPGLITKVLRTAFICLVLCVGIYGAFRSRFAALLLYFWFAFFRPQEWVYFDLAALHLSFGIALLLIIPSLASGIWPNLTHPLAVGMMLFLGATLLSQIQAVNAAIGWQWIEYMVTLIGVALLSISLIRTRRQLLLAVAVIAGSLGFHAAKAGVASILAGGLQFGDGLAGPWIDNNGYALAGAMIIFPLIAVGQNVKRVYLRYLCFLTAALTVSTIIGTFSREGFLALVTAAAVFILLQRRRLMMSTVFAAIIAVGLTVVPIPDGYRDRLQTIRTYREIGEASALSRLHFWEVGLHMALDQPFGVGLRNFELAYDRYDFLDGAFGTQRSVHSSHVQVLAELGFPGLFVWLSLLGYSAWIGLRVRARALRGSPTGEEQRFDFTIANGLLASLAAFVVGGSFIALALNDLTWVTFALFASLERLSTIGVPSAAFAAPVLGSNLAVTRTARSWPPAALPGGPSPAS
jgi:probable O-glycosylation ligase (exosortase A-associated)